MKREVEIVDGKTIRSTENIRKLWKLVRRLAPVVHKGDDK